MKIAIIAGYSPSLLNFRGPLLRSFCEHGNEVVALAPPDDPDVPIALERLGVQFLPIELRRASVNPLNDVNTLRVLVGHLRRLRPDKVLAYTPKPVIWGSLAARIARVPDSYALITGLGRAFAAEGTYSSRKQWALGQTVQLLYRVALASCRGVLFQNPDDRELFARLRLVRRKQPTIVTAGSGIDLAHFAPDLPVNVDEENGPAFLTLTRLLSDKGVSEFVAAATILKRKYPKADFRVVGPREGGFGGIDEATLQRWAEEGNVTFGAPVRDVRPELRRANVFVLASAYREGTPRSVLEALSTGRPVITTDTPGCRETVIAGRNGFLIPPRNAHALAESMERFVQRPSLINTMGYQSRALAEERFDVKVVNAQIMTFMGL